MHYHLAIAMKTSDFDYHLPESSIAQTPAEPRDSSRLLVLHRDTNELEHRIFRDVTDYLNPGDLLVLNQTRVIPARIYARKDTGGRVELLLLRRRDTWTWEALVGGKGLRVGKRVKVEEDGPEFRNRAQCFQMPLQQAAPAVSRGPFRAMPSEHCHERGWRDRHAERWPSQNARQFMGSKSHALARHSCQCFSSTAWICSSISRNSRPENLNSIFM